MAHALPVVDELVTPEEYLARETFQEIKHEYLGGVVHAMAGASEPHNRISTNLIGALHTQLRGHSCEAFGSDMKVKVRLVADTYFYYPDAMVACDPTDSGHGWRERPSMVFEILSEDTRRTDEREKRIAYRQIDRLQAYVRIEQNRPEAVVESRSAAGWKTERYFGLDAVIHFSEPALTLRLADLYERVKFPAA